MCQEGHGDFVASVDERETCSYVVTIHTSRICAHPMYSPPEKVRSLPISCNPLLSAADYEMYMKGIHCFIIIIHPPNVIRSKALCFCPVSPSMHACFGTLSRWYFDKCMTDFLQTFSNIDECLTFWGQKVKGQGRGGVKYAEKSSFWAWCYNAISWKV